MKLTFGDAESILIRNQSRPDSDTSTGETNKWRVESRKIIDEVIADYRYRLDFTVAEVEVFVTSAYPFGERSGHPYKMWMKEVNERMGRFRQERREAVDA